MEEFRKVHPNGDSYCSACKLLRYKKSRKDNPEKHSKYSWKSRIKRMYDLSEHEYNEMYIDQKGECAICNSNIELRSKRTHIDHDHLTGKIRGLLCHECNTALGLFKEDKNIMIQAIKYLESKAGMSKKKGNK